jgi:hypothetical protein
LTAGVALFLFSFFLSFFHHAAAAATLAEMSSLHKGKWFVAII